MALLDFRNVNNLNLFLRQTKMLMAFSTPEKEEGKKTGSWYQINEKLPAFVNRVKWISIRLSSSESFRLHTFFSSHVNVCVYQLKNFAIEIKTMADVILRRKGRSLYKCKRLLAKSFWIFHDTGIMYVSSFPKQMEGWIEI